ncbi:MAG: hypothetical protein FJ276_28445 [Planctomycetes bacterium]|nr:hypothetical protein [Planctomycetota bacterium]
MRLLGDVLFVRQTDDVQREIQGLFAALRKHARQTFIYDPPQHSALRAKLAASVSVDYLDTPLEDAVAKLAAASDADIRLDVPSLREIRIRGREPITLKLADRTLETVLQAMFLELNLTWLLQDGVLWITTPERGEDHLKTAVYDVRDLCADSAESEALQDAITSQTDPDAWDEYGGPGALQFARPGTLVVSQHESMHVELIGLLESYRTALLSSKPRDRHALDPNEVITVYYRMHAAMADDLVTVLPKLVQPDGWKSESHPDGQGEILRVASPPELFNREGQLAASAAKGSPAGDATVVVSRAVLVIRQTRAAHEKIAEVIGRVESGDAAAMGGMGGMGGGGFGGMF